MITNDLHGSAQQTLFIRRAGEHRCLAVRCYNQMQIQRQRCKPLCLKAFLAISEAWFIAEGFLFQVIQMNRQLKILRLKRRTQPDQFGL